MILSRYSAMAVLLAGTALVAACAPVPQLGARPEPRAAQSIASATSLASEQGNWPATDWWSAYGDPQLSALIAEGLASAPDLAAAAARLRKAAAYADQAGAAQLPSLVAEAAGGWDKQSYNNGIPAQFVPRGWNDGGRAALNLSFDPDLWGRNRAATAAATSEAEAAAIELAQARLVLSTNIAAAYTDLARLHAERDVLESALAVRSKTFRLVSNRYATGLDTQAEVKQAESAVPAARADLAANEEAIALTRNRIAALLGAGPDRGLAITRPVAQSLQPHLLPADATTDLIGRRPDIAAARARVEAAASRIKVARADFYPAINLSALIGVQSLGLDNLFDSGSAIGSVRPAITLPIFQGGALRAQYKGARADYDAAVAGYDQIVVQAYNEVADAVTSRRMLAVRLADSAEALSAAEQAHSVAQMRYEGGLSTFLDVLTAEDRVLQARRAVATLQTRAFTLDVALVRALGGGLTAANQNMSKDETHG
ncbi:efflux transporter outer membrane subunit [Sphingomonas sp. C3-2]|nr:efflux transporter outer membrane subunit [Sphingomonas sp. C3-2]WOK38267.1 efflux transporter outer membrane subunit [Sphingomonas sp. C3-2]